MAAFQRNGTPLVLAALFQSVLLVVKRAVLASRTCPIDTHKNTEQQANDFPGAVPYRGGGARDSQMLCSMPKGIMHKLSVDNRNVTCKLWAVSSPVNKDYIANIEVANDEI